MMQVESPDLPIGVSGIHANNSSRRVFQRDDKRPYDHIWELVGYLPRRKAVVDHLVDQYFEQLGPLHDCVHQDTFRPQYDAFWNRKWGDDDVTVVDLRWLALLFIMLSFAELLTCPLDASPESQRDCEEKSVQFFWAARKAIVLAPTFSGESPDLVRSGILVSWYLTYFGRKTESWLTSSFAIRMAQAQGMHIDGKTWDLAPKMLETRRRLWCKLYCLDRSISLAVGRPYTINDKHCTKMDIRNIWLEDMTTQEAASAQPLSMDEPTQNIYYMYQQSLSAILGDIHDECFGISSGPSTSYAAYDKVMRLDGVLADWANNLPSYFQLQDSDCSLDSSRPYLYWQRMYLHSAYHFARITLHRTYVLVESITDRFQYSREACISSACADLNLRLTFRYSNMADRIKAGGAMHNLFNSALVLGVIAVKDPLSMKSAAIVDDLVAYCEKQRADAWVNEFALAEVKVIELCIANVRKARREGKDGSDQNTSVIDDSRYWSSAAADSSLHSEIPIMDEDQNWFDNWLGMTRNFSEPMDFRFWESLVETFENGAM